MVAVICIVLEHTSHANQIDNSLCFTAFSCLWQLLLTLDSWQTHVRYSVWLSRVGGLKPLYIRCL